MKIEDAEWDDDVRKGRNASKSVAALRLLVPGDIKRIVHDDLYCGYSHGKACTLSQEIGRLRRKGWHLEYYHEAEHVLVVRRLRGSK